MQVNIIYPKDGWILQKIARELNKRLDYSILSDRKSPNINRCDINYYINYNLFNVKSKSIDVGLFTHIEEKSQKLVNKFFDAANKMDFCITMSKKYEDILKNKNVLNTQTINMGIDLDLFKPKLILGFIGHTDNKVRKGNELLQQIKELDFVELRATEGALAEETLPNFYRQLDYVIITSKYEGGPMCLVEGLACGIPVIAPDVGQVPDFDTGIFRYENSNLESLISLLSTLYQNKTKLREQVEHLSWDFCAESHDKLFKKLIQNKK